MTTRTPLAILSLASCAAALWAQLPPDLGRAEYYRPPKLTVMMGFIKDPQHKAFTVADWAAGIGSRFNAAPVIERFARAGVTQIIWYDKWIDGLVFRKTKTTNYVTARDFLAELAPACRKNGIKLVIYFNTFYDGNPEFAQWAAVDQRGKPIPFSAFWPENLLSIYSPFREKALEQIRELVVDYGVDGLYLDVPTYATISYDRWTRDAFKARMGKDIDDATLDERRRFATNSAIEWNQFVAGYIHRLNPKVTVATNELIDPVVEGPARGVGMARVVDYFTTELHTADLQINRGPILGHALKPFEIITLISDDWFTALNSGPLKSSKSVDEMHVELASIFSAGLNTGLALTYAHDGTLDEGTLKLVDDSGAWLRARRDYLAGAQEFSDVGILLGTPDAEALDWPGGAAFAGGRRGPYDDIMLKLERNLRQNGYFPLRLVNAPPARSYSELPKTLRALIIPDRAQISPEDRRLVERFAASGGAVIAFGRGGTLTRADSGGATGEPGKTAPLFGVAGSGYGAINYAVSLGADSKPIAVAGPALHLHPSAPAETVLWGKENRIGAMPFLVRSGSSGSGHAFLVAAAEADLAVAPQLLERIWREAIGAPAYRVLQNPERYAVRVRKAGSRTILHVIDTPTAAEGPMARYRPLYTKLALNAGVVAFTKATIVPDNRPVVMSRDGDWITLELFPDPELTIVLE
jgi:alpha-L-fucosidase